MTSNMHGHLFIIMTNNQSSWNSQSWIINTVFV